MIIFHICTPHAAQDRMYGQNNRVCNPMKKGGGYRCTVCDREQSGGAASRGSGKKK